MLSSRKLVMFCCCWLWTLKTTWSLICTIRLYSSPCQWLSCRWEDGFKRNKTMMTNHQSNDGVRDINFVRWKVFWFVTTRSTWTKEVRVCVHGQRKMGLLTLQYEFVEVIIVARMTCDRQTRTRLVCFRRRCFMLRMLQDMSLRHSLFSARRLYFSS